MIEYSTRPFLSSGTSEFFEKIRLFPFFLKRNFLQKLSSVQNAVENAE
jgi:hypothetical protein